MSRRRAAASMAMAAAAAGSRTANGRCAQDADCRTGAIHSRRVGAMSLGWPLLALAFACAHPGSTRSSLEPDREAMAEGSDSGEPQRFASARAVRHYLDALLAKNADDFATAAAGLREALLYDPESPHLHTVLAEVLLKQGRIADAEEELHIALSLDPGHAPARLVSARIAAARGKVPEAREHLLSAIDAQPDDGEAYAELVRLSLASGEGQE